MTQLCHSLWFYWRNVQGNCDVYKLNTKLQIQTDTHLSMVQPVTAALFDVKRTMAKAEALKIRKIGAMARFVEVLSSRKERTNVQRGAKMETQV